MDDLTVDEPREGEVLVRLVACGICHTDVAMRDSSVRAPKPIVLGHEGAGVVEAVGPAVVGLETGDHVVLSFASCGHCASCVRGMPPYCGHGDALNFGGSRSDGSVALHTATGASVHSHFFGQSSFATLAIAHGSNVVKVDRDLPLDVLAPLGCGVQTGAGAIVNSLRVTERDSVVVFGTGSVGLAAIMAARMCGVRTLIAVDINRSRLDLALELGATLAIDPGQDGDVTARLRDVVPDGIDCALDTTGREGSIRDALASLATAGRCGLVGISSGPIALDPRLLMVGARSLRGIVQGDSVPQRFIPWLIENYRQGRFPLDRLVRHYEFDQINDAMADMEAGRTIKPVLRMPRP